MLLTFFKGRVGSQDYVIFSAWSFGNYYPSHYENRKGIFNELRLLQQADLLLESFYEHAKYYKVKILHSKIIITVMMFLLILHFLCTGIHWNAKNTFIGTIDGDVLPPPSDGTLDTHIVQYQTFFAALLLDLQSCMERKLSGNAEVGNDEDSLGLIMNAFAHSIVVAMKEIILIVDLQGILHQFNKQL